jgi:hypothetical protein
MSFKIVNTLNIPGKNQGEEKLKSADYEYIKGMWNTEEELIANCAGADAVMGDLIRKPFVRKVIESFSPNSVWALIRSTWKRQPKRELWLLTFQTIVWTRSPVGPSP